MNGIVLFEGFSSWNEAPVVCIATGFEDRSKNIKTGPMIQVYVMASNVPPHVAVMTGQDAAVCQKCDLRQYTVGQTIRAENLKVGHKPTMCYVITSNGVKSTYNAYKNNKYGRVFPHQWRELFRGEKVRLGAYGNMSSIPFWVTQSIVDWADAHTLYDHNWKESYAQPFKKYAMASVSNESDARLASSMGWRYFRVKNRGERVLSGEIVCPASYESHHKTTCAKCLLCSGTSRSGPNIVIDDHGPTSRTHAELLQKANRFPLNVLS